MQSQEDETSPDLGFTWGGDGIEGEKDEKREESSPSS